MHKELKGWVEWLGIEEPTLSIVNSNASTKQYYRIENQTKKMLVLDASECKELVPRMLGIGLRLKETKVLTPLARSFEQHKGFMLSDDIGSTHLFDKCIDAGARTYYEKAIKTLVEMQKAPTINMKLYDMGFLIEEMNLMLEWYLKKYLGHKIECVEAKMILDSFMLIAKEVLAQPQETFVHSDYHSKNLMINENDEMVLIEFQDAREGALTYDLVSLLYDAYVALDKRERKRFIKLFKNLKGIEVDDETFMRWVDFTAIQRSLTQLGKFARLSIRDGKTTQIEHVPLVLQYILDLASNYPELEQLVVILTPEETDSIGFTL
ncbi:MAG: COG3178: Predicted phosphotransferase related to Ser/Thr protein kinases [uncultured Sulfurovum sp.]|uniref:COG3178: Predicted phosphotransferase related to Ser/Thr protein kinases n=1 Tax=uncultured Sulfurovum sp. TaxID=269237 RepID=A0A6S6TRV3_9BACT|nr:MAG: COG3178: Predicted phosphotransferase related to Ser/Thr protein kinases [uncultured Sulfurovum sp.]